MPFPVELGNLEAAILTACTREQEWPAQIAAGISAGVDYAIAHPEVAATLASNPDSGSEPLSPYETVIARLAGFIQAKAPRTKRLPVSTDEALVAGMVGLVGDHLRLGRGRRLSELRGDLVLLTLLPYLGFAEAQRWANKAAEEG
jgi:hypothetical protein